AYPLLTWLFKIAHNTALDFLRKKRPEQVTLDDADTAGELVEPSPGPEEEVGALLDGELLERLLAELPPLYREVLVLRHQQDLDLKETARVLGIPEGTAKIRAFRARELLRRRLDETGWA
ncbi:MAG: RNA polymerase sigma factor, partial [Elusimicrobia bacterium]|nr:RNA polymerase sigma factor [Elusimicrobiota bacterium]